MPFRNNMVSTSYGVYDSGAHSTSNQHRLAQAYPNSPIHSGEATTISDFTSSGIRAWYTDNVLNGDFPAFSDFTEGDYDYSTAVSIPSGVAPEGESAPGSTGSTIVASGLGPNVATIDKSNLAATPMVDATPTGTTPFEGVGGEKDPKDSSTQTGQLDVKTILDRGSASSPSQPNPT